MTYQGKAELFRLYLDGKIDFVKKEQKKELDRLFQADFGSKEYFAAVEHYEQAGAKVSALNQIRSQFNRIFSEEV